MFVWVTSSLMYTMQLFYTNYGLSHMSSIL